jgi:site-specific DNA-methyltransferase (adenine-specific)
MFNADCMDAMAAMRDKQYDLAIVDPPYGIGESGQRSMRGNITALTRGRLHKKEYTAKSWDNSTPNQDYFEQLARVSTNRIIWGGNHMGNMPPSPCWIVWDKRNGGNDFADCELAYTSFKTAVRKFEWLWNGFQQQNHGRFREKRIHPTQKPVALYKWILTNYAKPGQTILDTHGGSGSICIACHDLGFDLDWYELDKEYYDMACERFERHKQQQRLL